MFKNMDGFFLFTICLLFPPQFITGSSLTDQKYNVVIAISEKSSDSITDYDAFLNSVKVSPMQNWYRRG